MASDTDHNEHAGGLGTPTMQLERQAMDIQMDILTYIFNEQKNPFLINMAIGLPLKYTGKRKTNDVKPNGRYFVLKAKVLVSNTISNIKFFVTPLRNNPRGISEGRVSISDYDIQYISHWSIFNCLIRNIYKLTQESSTLATEEKTIFQDFFGLVNNMGADSKGFRLNQLIELENLFQVCINMYRLVPLESDPTIVVLQIFRLSAKPFFEDRTMNFLVNGQGKDDVHDVRPIDGDCLQSQSVFGISRARLVSIGEPIKLLKGFSPIGFKGIFRLLGNERGLLREKALLKKRNQKHSNRREFDIDQLTTYLRFSATGVKRSIYNLPGNKRILLRKKAFFKKMNQKHSNGRELDIHQLTKKFACMSVYEEPMDVD